MAYCKRCGAYIPDGQKTCLACGYKEETERKAAEDRNKSGFAKEYSAEKARMERERRKLEHDKQEFERQRRKQQEENRNWANEEYEKRQRQREQASYYADLYRKKQASEKKNIKHKALSILCYFSFFFIFPFVLCPEDEFAKFHAKQGMSLFIFSIISDVVSSIIPFGWLLTMFRIYCIFKGIDNVRKDKMEPLPYIGKYI